MKHQLEQRLKELKLEFDRGQKILVDLSERQAGTRDTMLRINGAIQVLEEMLNRDKERETEHAIPSVDIEAAVK